MIIVGIVGNEELVSFKRRFLLLLNYKDNEIKYQIAKKSFLYDIIITDSYTINESYQYKKIIFELPDNILYSPISWYKFWYKILYFIKILILKNKLESKLLKFDYIITGSKLQKKAYLKIHSKVDYIVDPIVDSLVIVKKISKINCNKVNLGLECGGLNIHSILNNLGFVDAIKQMDNIVLHIIIDDEVLPNRYQYTKVHKELKKVFSDKVVLYGWSKENYITLMNLIDIAVIPVDENSNFANTKPENRPLIMMSNMKPVVCSPILSYRENLSKFSTCFFAKTKDEWINKINTIIEFPKSKTTKELINNALLIKKEHNKNNFINFHNQCIKDLI